MSFRDNLLHLRATRNMTQEHLAMLVGVSRQSVAKWEAERSYPEMDKLLKLCQIFDCSLDDLVRGDLTARGSEPELAVADEALATDVVGYDEHQRTFARRIALGVCAIIAGIACSAFLEGLPHEGFSAIGLFGGIGIGLLLIIPAGMEHASFTKAHPYVTNFYSEERSLAEKRTYGRLLAAGICGVLLGLVVGALGEKVLPQNVLGGLFMLCVAVGVGLVVYAGMMLGRLDVESYNISALEELTEDEIAGIVGTDRAPMVLGKVRRSRRTGAACGVIMLVATAIALPLMFWATSADVAFWKAFFWIPWMVGGLLCGVASIILGRD